MPTLIACRSPQSLPVTRGCSPFFLLQQSLEINLYYRKDFYGVWIWPRIKCHTTSVSRCHIIKCASQLPDGSAVWPMCVAFPVTSLSLSPCEHQVGNPTAPPQWPLPATSCREQASWCPNSSRGWPSSHPSPRLHFRAITSLQPVQQNGHVLDGWAETSLTESQFIIFESSSTSWYNISE